MNPIAMLGTTSRFIVTALLCFMSARVMAIAQPAYSYWLVALPCASQILESSVADDRVTLTFSEPRQSSSCQGSLRAQTSILPPGSYALTVRSATGTTLAGSPISFTVDAAPPTLPVSALFHSSTNTFFVTASGTDKTALLAQGWQIVDSGFAVWPKDGPSPPTSKPVCRFFVPAKATHFYSANQVDCIALKSVLGFVDEGIVFRALVPSAGVCGLGTKPVYRLFDSVRSNHRYTTSNDTVNAMVTAFVEQASPGLPQSPSTWVNEGIAFCSPIQ